jgi:hypothetical protein
MVYDEQEDGEGGVHRAAVGSGPRDQEEAYEYEDGEGEYGNDEMEEEEEEESRQLTHQEIWDDSALINAWNSAEAEYEVRSAPSTLPCLSCIIFFSQGVPR